MLFWRRNQVIDVPLVGLDSTPPVTSQESQASVPDSEPGRFWRIACRIHIHITHSHLPTQPHRHARVLTFRNMCLRCRVFHVRGIIIVWIASPGEQ